jgi:regulator of protease activity HflC (stomatin/prohibitin superfamily)
MPIVLGVLGLASAVVAAVGGSVASRNERLAAEALAEAAEAQQRAEAARAEAEANAMRNRLLLSAGVIGLGILVISEARRG